MRLDRAWTARGTGSAYTVEADRVARSEVVLREAMDAAEEAAPLAPGDPGP
ncbi:hypothetical protein [Streptomyces spinosus]|uniref:hypothetical protein n=1 Tax=Streptomyces spinosus TaxID=2872623 RepID=UPI001CEC929C|nr:hypothetical protein [Streptomyces spinosus]